MALDGLLDADHRARAVWEFVERMDLGQFYGQIRAVEGRPGRAPIDPRILLALWLYATTEGVGSARAVCRLTEAHDAYRWICGGVPVNYHTLADFRVDHADVLDSLLTHSVAALVAAGVVDLKRVAQDGIRVRASAGAGSFRREPTLQECLADATEQVEALRKELEDDPAGSTRREEAAQERAAKERAERVQRALDQLPDLKAKKTTEEERAKARASTTDPEARVMKMADGGFRPAFNGQFATDTKTQMIVGVDVTNRGTDYGQLPTMLDQIARRYGQRPPEYLADGGYAARDDIETAASKGTVVFAPLMKTRSAARALDPYHPLPTDSQAVGAWRVRMGTEEAKAIYKERAATAECVHAIARNRGLQRFLVRGQAKARAVLLWFALAHNLMRQLSLRAAAVVRGTPVSPRAAPA